MHIKAGQSMYKNTAWLIILSVALKGIGFINRIVIAYFFGTTIKTDIYYIASGFIDGLSSIILASLSVGIISIYIKEQTNGNSSKFLTNILAFVELVMFALTVGCYVTAPWLSIVLAPNLDSLNLSKLSEYISILTITIPFIGAGSVISAALQAENHFAPVKLMGTITSAVSILSVAALSRSLGEKALCVSYIAGNVLNAVFVFICIRKDYLFKVKDIKLNKNKIINLLNLTFPLMIGLAAHEINLMIDKSLATSLTAGAASALSYCSVLYLFLENTIINSIVTVLYPNLVKHRAENHNKLIAKETGKAVYYTELILIPLVIVTFFFSDTIVSLMYQRGKFDAASLSLTSFALKGYIIGLPLVAIRDIATRVYYAYDDTKIPLRINLMSVCVNIFLDFALGRVLGIMGITLATTISNGFSAVTLFKLLHKHNNSIRVNLISLILLLAYISAGCICCMLALNYETHRMAQLSASAAAVFIIELLFLYLFDRKTITAACGYINPKCREKDK